MLGGVLSAQSTDDDKTRTAVCSFDDGKQMSVRYNAVMKENPPTGKAWMPGGAAMTLFTETETALGGRSIPTGGYTMYLLGSMLGLNFFVALANGDRNLQEAIDAPMFHTNHFPRSFYPHHAMPGMVVVEDRVGEDVVAELRRRGHDVWVEAGWSQGRLSAVADDRGVGQLRAAANPRGMQGYVVGR